MNAETKNLGRIAGAAGGTGVAVGAEQDWLQIAGIVIAAISTILPILQKLFTKKPGADGGNPALNLLLFCALASVGLTGCASLDKEGVYRGDAVIYHTELSIVTSYDVIQAFVQWEHENRAILAQWPEIKEKADVMRARAPAWFATAHAAHDAYKLDPSDANKTSLELSLSILRTALTEAMRHMSRMANHPTP